MTISKRYGEWDTNLKHSIKKQFSLTFISILTGTILLCLLFNVFFLKKYYVGNRSSVMKTTYDFINDVSSKGDLILDNIIVDLEKVCDTNDMSLAIADKSGNLIAAYTANNADSNESIYNRFMDLTGFCVTTMQNGEYLINDYKDVKSSIGYLELWGKLDNGWYILLRASMEGVKNDSRIANHFLIMVGIFTLIIGIASVLVMSRKLTKPIEELTDISAKMADLDFDTKYITAPGSEGNEIDKLGSHINIMSDKLKDTIDELKNANEELERDIEKKNELENMRSEFISNVSHELKTPIALIQGYAEGLKEGIIDDPDSRDYYLDVITDEASKMNVLVKNLLSLNELEFGNYDMSEDIFDMKELIDNCVLSLDIIIKQKDVKIDNRIKESLIVKADELKCEYVFRNIFVNAINYAKYNKNINIYCEKHDERYRFCIYNEGDNIADEDKEKLWDKFYKADKSRSREYGGSGIGLSIVKAVMNKLGNDYGFINEDNGVTFYFELTCGTNDENMVL